MTGALPVMGGQGQVQSRQNAANLHLNGNSCALNTQCSTSAATMAAEKDIFCVLYEELPEPEEIGLNTFKTAGFIYMSLLIG